MCTNITKLFATIIQIQTAYLISRCAKSRHIHATSHLIVVTKRSVGDTGSGLSCPWIWTEIIIVNRPIEKVSFWSIGRMTVDHVHTCLWSLNRLNLPHSKSMFASLGFPPPAKHHIVYRIVSYRIVSALWAQANCLYAIYGTHFYIRNGINNTIRLWITSTSGSQELCFKIIQNILVRPKLV